MGISVIVPSFNYGCFLGEALLSIVEQTEPFAEVVVVDDCSNDDTEQIARHFASRGVSYVRNPERRGIVWNLNNYLPALRSEWVCMVSADDWLAPTFVAEHAAVIAREGGDPKLGLVYCGARYTVTHTPTERPELDGMVIGLEEWRPEVLQMRNFVHGSAVIRRRALVEVGGFPNVGVEEDHACWRKFAEAGWRGVNVPEVLLYYRQHDRGHRNYGTDMRRLPAPEADWT